MRRPSEELAHLEAQSLRGECLEKADVLPDVASVADGVVEEPGLLLDHAVVRAVLDHIPVHWHRAPTAGQAFFADVLAATDVAKQRSAGHKADVILFPLEADSPAPRRKVVPGVGERVQALVGRALEELGSKARPSGR